MVEICLQARTCWQHLLTAEHCSPCILKPLHTPFLSAALISTRQTPHQWLLITFCMVFTECTKMALVSCGTSHVSTVSTPLQWIFKTRYRKLVTHVESHANAVSLLKREEQHYIKAINNNNKGLTKQGFITCHGKMIVLCSTASILLTMGGADSAYVPGEHSVQKQCSVESKTYLAADSPNRMPMVVISWPWKSKEWQSVTVYYGDSLQQSEKSCGVQCPTVNNNNGGVLKRPFSNEP